MYYANKVEIEWLKYFASILFLAFEVVKPTKTFFFLDSQCIIYIASLIDNVRVNCRSRK